MYRAGSSAMAGADGSIVYGANSLFTDAANGSIMNAADGSYMNAAGGSYMNVAGGSYLTEVDSIAGGVIEGRPSLLLSHNTALDSYSTPMGMLGGQHLRALSDSALDAFSDTASDSTDHGVTQSTESPGFDTESMGIMIHTHGWQNTQDLMSSQELYSLLEGSEAGPEAI
ncbi:hypothetical protein N0V95_010101 [Ascochyta clinopodiicola]|nr:hypothetical protein N0V95_010101 [Ascochyta clinopodiicola]